MSVLHQSICIFQAGLSIISDDLGKYNKPPDYEIPIKMLKQYAVQNSGLKRCIKN